MIKQSEIKRVSEEIGVLKSQIDKDWVLSYLLYGITSMPELQNKLVFKGGTSLKKCYFPDYRFSEDLDFTLLDEKIVFDKPLVEKIMKKASDLSFDDDFNRGILFKLKKIEPTQSNDVEQGFKVHINYWGADHRKNDLPSEKTNNWHHTIKLDINHTEEILFPVVTKAVSHNYSDSYKFENHSVKVYAIEEVLSEKLRSLIQRKYTSPRDCYDIWYLKNNSNSLDWTGIKNGFFRKMENKNLVFTGIEQLLNQRKERVLKAHWNTQLANQFPKSKIPNFNLVLPDLYKFLNNLFN
jgi:predicted nucleotidyltransferase component of viral defense system